MTHFFIEYGYEYSAKNEPQIKAVKYLRKLHGKLIPAEEITNVQDVIVQEIDLIFQEHPRCKKLNIIFGKRSLSDSDEKEIYLEGFPAAVNFKFCPAQLSPNNKFYYNDTL